MKIYVGRPFILVVQIVAHVIANPRQQYRKMLYEGLLLASEIVLSAYPMLIQLVDASVFFQTGLRMAVYAVLATVAAKASRTPLLPLDLLFSTESIYTGALNLLHVFSSYTAFDTLTAGNAMALFYTYPIWNILGASAAFGESIQWSAVPWISLALIGALLLSRPTASNWSLWGIIAALVAALTETGIYLWFRRREASVAPDALGAKDTTAANPWNDMLQMYGSSGILWALIALAATALDRLGAGTWRVSPRSLSTILAFNAGVGFIGYATRFYTIPRVSTIAFSALSFFGVVAAYGFDWLFMGTLPTATQALGAAAIVAANTILLRKETV